MRPKSEHIFPVNFEFQIQQNQNFLQFYLFSIFQTRNLFKKMIKINLIVILAVFVHQIFSFVGVSTVGHFIETKTNMIIHYVLISNTGDMAFVAMLDTDKNQKIRSFDITTGSFKGPKNFYQSTRKYVTNYVTFYPPNYIIGIQYTGLNFSIFYNTSQFIGSYTINETICDIVHSVSLGLVIEVSTSGTLYWVNGVDFPSAKYKNVLLSGVLGMSKAVVSPDGKMLAVGGSNQSKVYLVDLVSKTVTHTYTLNGNDTRYIVWNGDGSRIYAATGYQGTIFELVTNQPFTIKVISYQVSNLVRVASIELYSQYNELVIFTYCNVSNNVTIYSYLLSTMMVGHKQSYSINLTITGTASYGSNKLYTEWSDRQIYLRKVLFNCSTGSYYDQCLGKCNLCSTNCTSCTAKGCGTCPLNAPPIIVQNQTVPNVIPINTTTFNTTLNTTQNTTTNTTTDITPNATNNTNDTTVPDPVNQTVIQPQPQTPQVIPQPVPQFIVPNDSQTLDQKSTSFYQNFNNLLGNTLNSSTLSTLNQIPGARGVFKPFFTFFGNLDDFWLYNYHPRNYQLVITQTFQCIQQLERDKWRAIPYQKLWSFLGLNTSLLQQHLTYKNPYSSSKFIQIQGNSNEFLISTANFYFSNLIIIIVLFLLFRFLFFLLFRFRLSIFLRKYSFWPTLITLLLDGNLQISSYLTFFEFKWLFTANAGHKTLTVWIIVNFFFIMLFSVSCYFIFKYLYDGLAKYFYDNVKVSNIAAFYLMAQIGIRNILLGFVHSIDFSSYSAKILVLLSVEMCFLLLGFKIVRMKGIFECKVNVWINLMASQIRMIVIGIFLFEQDTVTDEITFTSRIFAILIISYMILGVINILIEITKLTLQVIDIFKPKFQVKQNNTINETFDVLKQTSQRAIKTNEKRCQFVKEVQNFIVFQNPESQQRERNSEDTSQIIILNNKNQQNANSKEQSFQKFNSDQLQSQHQQNLIRSQKYKKIRLRKTFKAKSMITELNTKIEKNSSIEDELNQNSNIQIFKIK